MNIIKITNFIVLVTILMVTGSCQDKANSVYNFSYGEVRRSISIYPYQILPRSENPYYNSSCKKRQMLRQIQTDSISEKGVMVLSLSLARTSLKELLEKYSSINRLFLSDVCLDLESDVVLSEKIKKIRIFDNVFSNHKLISKNISYLSLYYLNNDTLDIFKNSHIDTLYITSGKLKKIKFENTTIDVLIPDDLNYPDSLDINFLANYHKIKKVYSKEEAQQYLVAQGQKDVY